MTELKPDECVHKAMLSTRSRLVGEYSHPDEPGLLVTHAWQLGPEMYRNLVEGAYSRSYFVAVFRTEPVASDKPLIVLPDYAHFADFLAVHLTILYGKHFQSHGLIESSGHFRVPEPLDTRPTSYYAISCFNHKPRSCMPTPLNLAEVSRIRPVIDAAACDNSAARVLCTAGQFYSRALSEFEEHPELAYLDLVACGEIIASGRDVPDDRLYDDQIKTILSRVKMEIADGAKVADMIRDRLYQVRRRFSEALADLLDEYFFSHPESKETTLNLRAESIRESLKAAYDLRSKYVHAGVPFGAWMQAQMHLQGEIPFGTPVLGDDDLKKLLVKAPTFCGLERIMRYALLKIAAEAGATLDDLKEDQKAS